MSGNNTNAKPPRYALLDELRGLAIVLMVVYHAFYSLGYVFGSQTGRALFAAVGPVQPFIAGTFIVLCGICSRLSRSNLRRGLKLAGAAALVTLATLAMTLFGVDEVILFGVLHFLACAVLLFSLAQKAIGAVLLQKLPGAIPPWVQLPVFAALFLVWRLVRPPLTGFFPLYVLGFPSTAFSSADYFPIFPWLFLFLAGTALGIYAKQGRLPAWCVKSRVPPLAWLGRHSLLIYLLHQPVLVGVFSLLRLVA
jgi:uncharacterized membrane protein